MNKLPKLTTTDYSEAGLSQRLTAIAVKSVLLFLGICSAKAETIVVDSLADDNIGCTLRNAVTAANINDVVGDCRRGTGTDSIIFDPALLPGTISLQRGQLAIIEPLRIQGPGADELEIVADIGERIFFVSDFTSGNIPVILHGLTLRGGDIAGSGGTGVGGAIFNREDLLVIRSEIVDNRASEMGGGIFHNDPTGTATLAVRETTLVDNQADRGGGVANDNGSVALLNSTISGNTATRFGGGLFSTSILTVTNSTIANNVANAALGVSGGGGLDSAGASATASLSNTLIAGSGGGSGVTDCFATGLEANLNNLIEDGSCSPDFAGDPFLNALGSNGGRTSTHRLMAGSAAVGNADAEACPRVDQRGALRFRGDPQPCDIGAYEFGATTGSLIALLFSDSFEDPPGLSCSVDADCPGSGSCTEGVCAFIIGGRVFVDRDDDGTFSSGDNSVSSTVVATLQTDSGGAWFDIANRLVDGSGFYSFPALNPLFTYRVRFQGPIAAADLVFTTRDAGADDTIDSDVDAFGFTGPISVQPDSFSVTHWAGIIP